VLLNSLKLKRGQKILSKSDYVTTPIKHKYTSLLFFSVS